MTLFCHRFFFHFDNSNKSTSSGAIYARSLCQGEVDAVKRGPKLNLIKNFGEGGGGNPTTLTVSSLVSEF